jgi:hypothetical protein
MTQKQKQDHVTMLNAVWQYLHRKETWAITLDGKAEVITAVQKFVQPVLDVFQQRSKEEVA